MTFVLKLIVGVALFWIWFFVGSRDQCPNCGVSLVDEGWSDVPFSRTTVRDSCSCGWRRYR